MRRKRIYNSVKLKSFNLSEKINSTKHSKTNCMNLSWKKFIGQYESISSVSLYIYMVCPLSLHPIYDQSKHIYEDLTTTATRKDLNIWARS